MAKHRTVAVLLVSFCAIGPLAGCGNGLGRLFKPGPKIVRKPQANLVEVNYRAVDQMLGNISPDVLPADSRVLAATFVDVDDLTNTSTLGRIIGEMCSARLTQRGYPVVNLKLRRDSVVIQPQRGEFFLTRDVKQLSSGYDARAVLVGTYTRTRVESRIESVNVRLAGIDPSLQDASGRRTIHLIDDYLYVSLRLINVKDNSLIGAYDYRIAVDENIESLLTSRSTITATKATP